MSSSGVYFALGALVLALVLAYAMFRNATRNKANDAITEEATRMEYEDPEGYRNGGREALMARLKR